MSFRPRLDKDVIDLAAHSAKVNGRSFPDEINFALRNHYLRQAAIIPRDSMLDPNPFVMKWDEKKKCYDNPPTMVTLNMDMIPPTYWAPAQWRSYATTCIYPGTEKSANPVKHTREQVDAQLRRSGYSKLIPKKKAKR